MDTENIAAMNMADNDKVTNTVGSNVVEMGYNANLSADVVAFESAMQRADGMTNVNAIEQVTALDKPQELGANALTRLLVEPLNAIDNEARQLVDYAKNAVSAGDGLSPSDIIMLTARSQEFMFHSQLTANVANRTADGVTQLFRQQS